VCERSILLREGSSIAEGSSNKLLNAAAYR